MFLLLQGFDYYYYQHQKTYLSDGSMVDFSNGSDLELPPNGWASQEGIKYALYNIASFFSELKETDITVVALMLGQGLVGMEDVVKNALRGVLSEEKL